MDQSNSKSREEYNERIRAFIDRSVECLAEEEYEKAALNDEEMLSFLKKKSVHKKDIDAFDEDALRLVNAYVESLYKVTYYQRDKCINNPSAELFIKEAKDDSVFKKLLSEDAFATYVSKVMHLCIWLQRMDSYRAIYDKHIKAMDDVIKSKLVVKLLRYYIGDIDIEETRSMILRLDEQMRDFDKMISEAESKDLKYDLQKRKTNQLCRIIDISDMTYTPIDPELMDPLVKEQFATYRGRKPNAIVGLAGRLIRKDMYIDIIEDWFDSIKNKETPNAMNVRIYLEEHRTRSLQDNRFAEPSEITSDADIMKNIGIMLHDKDIKKEYIQTKVNEYEKQCFDDLKAETDMKKKIRLLVVLYSVKHRLRVGRFWADFDNALDLIPDNSDNSDTLFFLHTDQSPINGACAFPIIMAAKKRGYYCIPSSPNLFTFHCDDDELLDIAGSRYFVSYSKKVDTGRFWYDWKIDIPGKSIEADGFNIFQPIYDVVSRWQFSCKYNFDTNAWARSRTYHFIRVMEKGLMQCEMLDDWAEKHGKSVRILLTSPHVPLYAAYRIYCEAKGFKNDVNAICVRSGYDDYFGGNVEVASTLTAINMTKHPEAKTSLYGTKEGFERFYLENSENIDVMRSRAEEWFKSQRSKQYDSGNRKDDKKRKKILKRIKKHKAAGKKVYLMIGKLIFDMGVKYTKGCAHYDLSHWATHTAESLKNDPDALLLIKPHPHETRKTITMTDESIVTFRDIIDTDISSDNIIYMEGQLFRIFDLAPFVDIGLVWNSTSALEMAAMGIKVMMGDECAYNDFPIGFPRVYSIAEYERFLADPDSLEYPSDIQDKAIAFLSYMSSDHVNLINKYTEFTASNYNQFDATIDMDEVRRYRDHGDERLERMIDEIL